MDEANRISIRNIGILVIIIPAILYAFIYMYEFGYLYTFGVPFDFIVIDMGRLIPILFHALPKIGVVLMFWILINHIFDFDMIIHPVGFEIYRLIKVIFVTGSISIFSPNGIELFINTSYIFPILIFYSFIYPLITQRKVKGYSNKIIAQYEFEKKEGSKNIITSNIKTIGKDNIITIFFAFLIAFVMFQNGHSNALSNTEYYLYEDKVVVRIYGDYLICSDYDESNNTLSKSKFEIVNYKNADSIELEKVIINDIIIK